MIQVKVISSYRLGGEDFIKRVNEFCAEHPIQSVTYHITDDYPPQVFIVYEKQT